MTQSSQSSRPSDPTVPIQAVPDADERLQVLRLLENGEITPDEAGLLLDALDAEPDPVPTHGPRPAAPGSEHETRNGRSGPDPAGAASQTRQKQPQLRIRVSDTRTGKARVNLTIPLGFLDAGYRLARRIVPGRVPDAESFQNAIRDGFRGHLIDVTEGDEHVEILVE